MWEQGKRLMWFDQEAIDQIGKGNYNYSKLFAEDASVKLCEPDATFMPPAEFKDEIAHIKSLFELQYQTEPS